MISKPTQKLSQGILLAVVVCAAIGVVGLFAIALPPAVDWDTVFRPAALKLASGQSPYGVTGFFNPPWALIPLIPIAILPIRLGRAILLTTAILSFSYLLHRLGAKRLSIVFILLSPPVLHGILNGNIDWLAMLGLVLPPYIGLLFIMIKPQIGVAVAAFWVFEAWHEGRWRGLLLLLWPSIVLSGLSIVLFGHWYLRARVEVDLWWNASLWPMSIPVGLALLTSALRKRDIRYAIGASPCLSPYVLFHSWSVALVAISNSLPELITSVLGLWALVAIRAIEYGYLDKPF